MAPADMGGRRTLGRGCERCDAARSHRFPGVEARALAFGEDLRARFTEGGRPALLAAIRSALDIHIAAGNGGGGGACA